MHQWRLSFRLNVAVISWCPVFGTTSPKTRGETLLMDRWTYQSLDLVAFLACSLPLVWSASQMFVHVHSLQAENRIAFGCRVGPYENRTTHHRQFAACSAARHVVSAEGRSPHRRSGETCVVPRRCTPFSRNSQRTWSVTWHGISR